MYASRFSPDSLSALVNESSLGVGGYVGVAGIKEAYLIMLNEEWAEKTRLK